MVELRDDLRLALDRVEFARAVGIEPDDWQRDALRSAAPRQLYNCARQTGKSTVSAILATHTAIYEPGVLVLLISPTLRQSGELFRKCLEVYRAAQRLVPPDSETALTLALENGSRIVSLPGGKGHTIRGYSGVRLLVVDEASRVPDDLYISIRPFLATSAGRLVALSTPFGTRGWWWGGLEERRAVGEVHGDRGAEPAHPRGLSRRGAPQHGRVVFPPGVLRRVPRRSVLRLPWRRHRRSHKRRCAAFV